MLGAIIGDIVGSTREIHNIKTEDFELVPDGSSFTDDSVMTLAVAEWLMTDPNHCKPALISCMQWLGKRYGNAGYGPRFKLWLMDENPQPYGSYGNGSAMRVSPIGMYAGDVDEAINLARISAEVSHSHPEGIKGAQAIAACVFMHKHGASKAEIKDFVEKRFGYNLDIRLEDLRKGYEFDVSCQGSVPVAIMAFLQRDNAEDILRLAISMGGDSDTIGCMASSIATAVMFDNVSRECSFSEDLIARCRALLPSDLLDISDRFDDFISRPLRQSYHVDGKIFAGEYPGDVSRMVAEEKIRAVIHFGIRNFIDLTEEGELRPYDGILPEGTKYYRFPVPDCNIPKSTESVHKLIDMIDELNNADGYTYVHCWGGVGRTGTIIACYLARHMEEPSIEKVIYELNERFKDMPKSDYRTTPETRGQVDFIESFIDSCKNKIYERH